MKCSTKLFSSGKKNWKNCEGEKVGLKVQCEECGKYFCPDCPAGPLEDETKCLGCMFDISTLCTSTPGKIAEPNYKT